MTRLFPAPSPSTTDKAFYMCWHGEKPHPNIKDWDCVLLEVRQEYAVPHTHRLAHLPPLSQLCQCMPFLCLHLNLILSPLFHS